MNNIVLCGFMGSGKTTVGKVLADNTGRTFYDMDTYIEEQTGLTVEEIFKKYGESHFRNLEHEAAKEFAQMEGVVLATGGGALMNPQNADILKHNGVIVLLEVSPETVCERLEDNTTRPLLMGQNKLERINQLLSERTPVYKQVSDYSIDGNADQNQVAATIIKALGDQFFIDK